MIQGKGSLAQQTDNTLIENERPTDNWLLETRLIVAKTILGRLTGHQYSLSQFKSPSLSTYRQSKIHHINQFRFKQEADYIAGQGYITTIDRLSFYFSFEWRQESNAIINRIMLITQSALNDPLVIQLSPSSFTALQLKNYLPDGGAILTQESNIISLEQKTEEQTAHKGVQSQLSLWFNNPQTIELLTDQEIAEVQVSAIANPYQYSYEHAQQTASGRYQSAIPLMGPGAPAVVHQVNFKV